MDNYLKQLEDINQNKDIFNILNSENTEDFIKIFSIININEINSKDEFEILLKHLINHNTPLREMTSIKLEEINDKYPTYFENKNTAEIILKSLIDINPNISRIICNIISNNSYLKSNLELKLIEAINRLLAEIEEYQKNTKDCFDDNKKNKKNHAKNKKLFALYWYLEALSICMSNKYIEKILKIVTITIEFCDYTIREKTAKIVAKMPNCSLDLIKKIEDDQNFYVKNQVYVKIDNEID